MAHTFADLSPLRNARAATADSERAAGGVNAWGNSFPAEELPSGGVLRAGGTPFALPEPRDGYDHVEALGQALPVAAVAPCTGLAILCFGEMGEQALTFEVAGAAGGGVTLRARAPEWLVERGHPVPPHGFACSHLHYPGGYELDALRPVLWCNTFHWNAPLVPAALRLGINPLFHLVGATWLHPAQDGAGAARR